MSYNLYHKGKPPAHEIIWRANRRSFSDIINEIEQEKHGLDMRQPS